MNKRKLSTIQSDLDRAEDDARIAKERLQKLKEEEARNDDFQRQAEFKRLLNDVSLYTQLFEGDDAFIDLSTVSLDKAKKVVNALKQWKDKAVSEALKVQSRATRVVLKTEESIDHDPYDGRPYKQYITSYSDGSSDVRYGGSLS